MRQPACGTAFSRDDATSGECRNGRVPRHKRQQRGTMKDFEIIVVDGTNPSGVAMTRDILEAGRLFATRTGQPPPTWSFHSPTGGRVRLQGGLSIDTA